MAELERVSINLEILKIAFEVSKREHKDLISVYNELIKLVWR